MGESIGTIGQISAPDWLARVSSGGRGILDLLLKSGGLSQAELTARLDLSQPSVARLIGTFGEEGLVRLTDRVAEKRGNPSVHVTLNPDYAFALGIGMVGDALSMTILDFTGRVRGTRSVAMRSMARSAVLKKLPTLKQDLIAATEIDPARLVGAGVGFSGFFVGNPPRFNPPELLRDWAHLDVAALLTEPLGLNVVCENDATAAAVAESLLGVGRTCPTFAYCHLTNGFGGGLISEGKPVRGAFGNAGDFGGVLWLLDEGYPNLDLLRTHVAQAGKDYATVEDMVRKIGPETPGVPAWIHKAKGPIGKLAFMLGHIFAPEKVVIGGRLPHAIAAKLAGEIRMPATPVRNDIPFPLPQIVPSEVAGHSVSIGAAAMPLQQLFFG
jgi:predicted NBD/HSP70 family sugar kinase